MSIKTFAISICQTLFLFFWSPPLVKPLTTKPPSSSTLNSQSTPSTRGQVNSRAPCDGVHRIRVDFKRNHDVEKVWEAGGLSLLTSVPITPRVLCFLCASSGNAEVKIILIFFFSLPPLSFLSSTQKLSLYSNTSSSLSLSACSLSSASYAVNRSISFAWGNRSALSRSSLRTGVVDDADTARPVGASTRKLK